MEKLKRFYYLSDLTPHRSYRIRRLEDGLDIFVTFDHTAIAPLRGIFKRTEFNPILGENFVLFSTELNAWYEIFEA